MTWAAVAVGLAFIVSGATKFFSPTWPAQARAMGSPAPLARVLPVMELVPGVLAVADVARPWALGALGLLLIAFTIVVVRLIVRGSPPPCACFGPFSTRPVGWATVARNTGLLVVVALALT